MRLVQNLEPCGTPNCTSISSDVLSFTCTNNRFSRVKLRIQCRKNFRKPILYIFSRVLVWSTMLNAFEKSPNVASVSFTSLHNLDDVISEVQ